VQHLGALGLHPRALAGGEDDGRERHGKMSYPAWIRTRTK
jgi:hypothetical protein